MRAAPGAADLASRVIARKTSRRGDIAIACLLALVAAQRSRIEVNSALIAYGPAFF